MTFPVPRNDRTAGKRPVFLDAFAGCGGLSLGLMQAGCKGRLAIEKDQFAFDTLKTNLLRSESRFRFAWPKWLPKEPASIDLILSQHSEHLAAMAGTIDLLVGGPPCQGFSSAGKRKHDDPRNTLFKAYLRLVDLIRPRAVLIENVRGFTTDFDNDGKVINYAGRLRRLLTEQYDVHERLLNVSLFGVPQGRTRYFLLALEPGLCDGDPFDHLHDRLPSFLRTVGLQAPVSSRAAISDLETRHQGRRPSVDTEGFDEIAYGRPLTRYQRLMNEGIKVPTDLRLARHAPAIERRFGEIIELSHAAGRLNTSIGEDLRNRFGLKKMALRVLDPDRPAPTVTSMPDDLLHYSEHRTLTVRENARLQSFPDWFAFRGKYTTGGHRRRLEVPRFTQVANAVPPLVARALGELLIDLLNGKQYRPAFRPSGGQRLKKSPEILAQL